MHDDGPIWLRRGGQHAIDARILNENRARVAPKRKATQRSADEEKTRENQNMSQIDDARKAQVELEGFFQDAAEGVKFDAGKLRFDLLPPEVENAIARILTDGECVARIPGYDSYLATNMGNIFSLHRLRFLKPDKIWCGYLRVKLDGWKNELVHRLVLSAFFGVCGEFVNHKNGNKTDNRIANLEWCTKSQNTKHSYQLGLQKARNGEEIYNALFTERDIRVIRGLYAMGATQKEIGELFGVRQANISDIVRGKTYRGVI